MRIAGLFASLRVPRHVAPVWVMVAAAAPLLIYVGGVASFTPGLLIKELQDEFGWSVGALAFAFSFQRLEGGITAPAIGYFIDRFGGRRILIAGQLFTGLGFVLVSQVHSLWQWYLAFLVISFGTGMGYFGTVTAIIVKWLDRRRGLGMGVVAASNGLGALMLPLAAAMISLFGWRTAMLILAVGVWALCIPLSLVFRDRPSAVLAAPGKRDQPKVPVGAVLRSPTFWIVSFAGAAFGFHYSSLLVFVIPHLQRVGFTRESAALATLLIYVIGVPARILLGFAADYVSPRRMFAAAYFFMAVGLIVLSHVTQFWHMLVFAVIYGWAQGCLVAVQTTLQAEVFGTGFFATVRGMSQPLSVASGVAGPLVAGFIFDSTGSYQVAFYVFAAAVALPAPLLLLVRPIPALTQTPKPAPKPA